MFYGCESLISLDLSNYNSSFFSRDMFTNCNPKLIFCMNDQNIPKVLKNYTLNCSNICFTNDNHKLIKEKSICVDDCTEDYNFEYNILINKRKLFEILYKV